MFTRIVISLLSLIIIACQGSDSGIHQTYDGLSLVELINKERSTGIKKDTIFLGLTFGMTEKELNSVLTNKLLNKKIITDDDKKYVYVLNFKGKEINLQLSADFYEGKLSRLRLTPIMNINDDQRLMFFDLYRTLKGTIKGANLRNSITVLDKESLSYNNIQGNRRVLLDIQNQQPSIDYIDTYADSLKTSSLRKAQKDKFKTQQKDF
jgi:hypothetical protein|tara:strand:+ start:729 stop:1352 length:624 start_codon:yes stop_codon:yes gene_type:complete